MFCCSHVGLYLLEQLLQLIYSQTSRKPSAAVAQTALTTVFFRDHEL